MGTQFVVQLQNRPGALATFARALAAFYIRFFSLRRGVLMENIEIARHDCQSGVEVSNKKTIQEYFWEMALVFGGFNTETYRLQRFGQNR